MSERSVKRLLAAVPADRDAEERAWAVVSAAYAEHEPVHSRPPLRFGLAVAALLCAIAAAAFSPPGRAVVDAVRRTIGVEHAAPALFRLPASGRLLVSGSGGTWLVAADGSKRRLGDYTPGEIAQLLDLPRGTVNSRLRRGLDRLEEELQQ